MVQPPRYFFQALPLGVPAQFAPTGTIASATPWNTFGLSGLRGGLFKDGRGNPSMIINGEWPVPGAVSADKEAIERLHLDRFCTDTLIGTGSFPYSDISPGSDPPDFVGNANGQEVGIECTQLTSPDRRDVKALFERVRMTIQDANRDRFRHLRGVNIYMWFDVEGQISKPPKRTDTEFLAEILEGLDAYRFDPAKAGLPRLSFPTKHRISTYRRLPPDVASMLFPWPTQFPLQRSLFGWASKSVLLTPPFTLETMS